MSELIFKILRPTEWERAKGAATFDGAPIDFEDGYIHFSTADQVEETARLYFSDSPVIHILAVDTSKLVADKIKWEPARDGTLFPHLYAALPMAAVNNHWTIETAEGKEHCLTPVFQDLES